MVFRCKCLIGCFCLLIATLVQGFLHAEAGFSLDHVAALFPSQGFERQIEFWKKIFTQYEATQVIFHDQDDLRLIYELKNFDRDIDGDSQEADRQKEVLKQELKELQAVFESIAKAGPDSPSLGRRERHIVSVFRSFGYEVTPALLGEKKESIRFQRGVRTRFRESLVRAGLYLPWIEATFRQMGLPAELSVLPHVESSFNYNAYSHAGAAGIWQFTRGTGRSYLRINRSVDERLDPIRATVAAARLLSENFQALGNWPLAITSYNHGRNGMLRAKEQCGGDLRDIIRSYESKYFGFASKNFYAEFLAALEVSRNFRRYFGDLEIEKPLEFDTITLAKACPVASFTRVPGVTVADLRDLNPHLKGLLSRSRRTLPAGIEVRVPPGRGPAVEKELARLRPAGREVSVAANGEVHYRVGEGDTLGSIAAEFRVAPTEIVRLNSIRDANRIFPGQMLVLGQSSALGDSVAQFFSRDGGDDEPSLRYTVRVGDNLSAIAGRFGTTVMTLVEANDIEDPDAIQPGSTLEVPVGTGAAPTASPRRYVIKRGDTLLNIAQRFGSSVERILRANAIRDPNRIRLGQEIEIP
jgi:membrane-bound lytic murein transglycosylase D